LGGFLLLVPAILGWGCLAVRGLEILPSSVAARLLLIFLLGQLTASLLLLVIGLFGVYPLGVWLVLLGAGGLVLEAPHWRSTILRPLLGAPAARPWVIAAIAVCFLALIPGLAPVVESDGLRYHLFTPQEWIKAGRIIHIPHNAFTNLPLQQNLLYLAGLVIGESRTPQLLHALNLPAVMIASGLLASNVLHSLSADEETHSEFPAAAGLVVGTMPVLLVLAGWPFSDLATLAFVLGALWVATSEAIPTRHYRLLLAGLFAGAAIATKLTALIPAFLLGLTLLLYPLSSGLHPPAFLRHLRSVVIWFALPSLLVPAPWLLKSTLIHGNPIYPAAYAMLGGAEWSEEADHLYKERANQRGFGKTLADFIASPFDVTLRWSRGPSDVSSRLIVQEARERGLPSRLFMKASPGFEDQNPGPAPLVLLPLALAALVVSLMARTHHHPSLPPVVPLLVLQLIGGWIGWFVAYQAVRFALLPLALSIILAVPLLALLANRNLALRLMTHTLLALCALMGFAWFLLYSLFTSPTRPYFAAFGLIDPDRILDQRFNAWNAVRFVNDEVQGPDERVVYIGEHRGFHAQYPVLLSDWFDVPLVLVEIRATSDNASLLRRWREAGIRYVLLNQAELGLYERGLFQPRFAPDEWQRFEDLRALLLSTPDAIAFRDPERPVTVIDLDRLPDA
jgi:hypothetical protein